MQSSFLWTMVGNPTFVASAITNTSRLPSHRFWASLSHAKVELVLPLVDCVVCIASLHFVLLHSSHVTLSYDVLLVALIEMKLEPLTTTASCLSSKYASFFSCQRGAFDIYHFCLPQWTKYLLHHVSLTTLKLGSHYSNRKSLHRNLL